MQTEHPDLATRKQMLEQKRSQFRAQGFNAEMEIAALSVQTASGDAERKEQARLLKDLRSQADNAYAGAKALTELLGTLDIPEPPPADTK